MWQWASKEKKKFRNLSSLFPVGAEAEVTHVKGIPFPQCRWEANKRLQLWGVHPRWSVIKDPPANAGDPRLIPWVRKIPWRRKWQPTPGFFPEKPHRQRRGLAGYSPWDCRVRHNLVTKEQQQQLVRKCQPYTCKEQVVVTFPMWLSYYLHCPLGALGWISEMVLRQWTNYLLQQIILLLIYCDSCQGK